MKCRKCGCELTGDEKFCPICGEAVVKECPKCGAVLAETVMFCPCCGTKVEKANMERDESALENCTNNVSNSVPQSNNVQTEVKNHYEPWERTSEAEIICKKAEYYQKQFDEIRSGKKGKINWASFFLGLFHAGYRNVWKEWLKGPGIPQLVTIIALIFGGIISLISGESSFMVLIGGITGIAQLAGVVLHIRFALHFNRIYEKHVADKMSKKDHRPDPSILRAILVSVILSVALGIGQAVYGAGSIGAILLTASSDTGTDLSEILTLEESSIVKFMKKNGFVDEDDLGMYTKDGTWILLDESGRVDMVNLEAPDYSIYGLRVGDAISVQDVSDMLSAYGYSLLGEYDGEIAYGIPYGNDKLGEDNLLNIQTDEYYIIQRMVYSKTGALEAMDTIAEQAAEYVFPDSDRRYLTKEELSTLSYEKVACAYMEIPARYGVIFESLVDGEIWQEYFMAKSWYIPIMLPEDFSDDMLNKYELANMNLLSEYLDTLSYGEVTDTELTNWIGSYVSDEGQMITITSADENGVFMTYGGYSEEGWHTQTYTLPYSNDSKTQVTYEYSYNGQVMQETVYTLYDDGIMIEVLPSGGWEEGFYSRQ